MHIARLGFEFHSKPLADARGELRQLVPAARDAEKAVSEVGRASDRTAGEHNELAGAAKRAAMASTDLTARSLDLTAAQNRAAVAQSKFNAMMAAGPQPMERMAKAQAALASAQASVMRAQSAYQATTQRVTAYSTAIETAGRSSKYFAFQQRNLAFQLMDVSQSLALGMSPLMVMMQQGPQIAQIYGPGEGGLARAFKEAGSMALSLVTRMGPIAPIAGIGAVAIAGMAHEIEKTTGKSVTFGQVAYASFQVARDGIYGLLRPAINAVGPWIGSAWDWIVDKTKWLGNTVINSFRAAFEDIKFLYNQLPNIVGAAVIGTANSIISTIEKMINKKISALNAMASYLPWGVQIDPIKLGTIDNPYADALSKANSEHEKLIKSIMSSDPLGQFFNAVRDQTISNLAANGANATKGVAKQAADIARGVRDIGSAAQEATRDLVRFGQSTTTSIITDFKNGLRDGKNAWKSFADAALNALDTISNRLIEMAVSSLFSNAFGGPGGISGSFVSMFSGGGQATGAPMNLLASLPGFDVGSRYVPHDMVARVHAREAILTPREADDYRRQMMAPPPNLEASRPNPYANVMQDMHRPMPAVNVTVQAPEQKVSIAVRNEDGVKTKVTDRGGGQFDIANSIENQIAGNVLEGRGPLANALRAVSSGAKGRG